ncbi:DsbA family protein [Haloferax sp. DFSO52]|uniref:DsbA family protein n=1 Tax=Haloferax sp. DFSO52 TaxID=3388505 RepID=UPI003A8A2DF9
MVDRPVSRRQLLALSGVSIVSALSGCASVVEQANSGAEQTATRTDAPETQTTTTTASNATTTESETQESVENRPKTISEPKFDLPSQPVPDASPDPRYPTLGTADTTLTIFGNWKCPYTQAFVRQQLGRLVDDFVVTGDVSIEYRNVAYMNGDPYLGADAPRAAEAGLAVWDIDPDAFWTYFAHVFANQPQERFEWATAENLTRFAERADVEGVEQVQQALRSRSYAQSVRQSAEAATEMRITTVPRVVFDGEVTAPTVQPEATRRQFERAATGESTSGDELETGSNDATGPGQSDENGRSDENTRSDD